MKIVMFSARGRRTWPTAYRSTIVVAVAINLLYFPLGRSEAASGALDPAFGSGGKAITHLGANDQANAIAIQPDGRIVVVGGSLGVAPPDFALARYNTDGSLDTSFDSDGKVTTDILGFVDFAEAVAVQPDGKIVVAGHASISFENNARFALVRYNADGSLDTTFGTGGKVTTSFTGSFDQAVDMVLQPDGKIVAVGVASSGQSGRVALARYNPTGALDMTFGTGGTGLVTAPVNGGGRAEAVVLQPDGKIVICGYAAQVGMFGEDFLVARFTAGGQLDPNFGSGGITLSDMSGGDDDGALDIALQVDGKLVAIGYAVLNGDLGMARYNENGTLDIAFGDNGKVITNEAGGEFSRGRTVLIQADGKIAVAGEVSLSGGSTYDFALWRYDRDGGLDIGFGTGGRVTTDFTNNHDRCTSAAQQPDGKIILAGFTSNNFGDTDFALARYITAAASNARVSGKVTTPDGRGFANVTVSLTNSLGVRRIVTTSSFGLFSFDNVPPGQTYAISVLSKRYRFVTRNQLVNDNVTNVDFAGGE